MKPSSEKKARRLARAQNLAIIFLALSSMVLFANLPLFGPLSDRSLLELAQDRVRRESLIASAAPSGAVSFVFPVRMVCTNSFARQGADALTTLSDEFERAGTYLGEAIGSAHNGEPIGQPAFLAALRAEGLYFDFTAPLSSELLEQLLNVSRSDTVPDRIRRLLLSPSGTNAALLYAEDGSGQHYRYFTAVSSPSLTEYLASRGGSSANFAFLLAPAYSELSPYTLILSDPAPRGTLKVVNALSGNEDEFLRRAEFNAHTENRFTESSGTVIVREVSSTLYLRPDGTIEYQGTEAAPGSIYSVPAALPGKPTLLEAASAAQNLALTLLGDSLGDASCYLSAAVQSGSRYEITFDLMSDGTLIRYSDSSHTGSVTIENGCVTAFTFKVRSYTITDSFALMLPFAQAAAIARVWPGAELIVAYVDVGSEEAMPAWIAE